MQIQNKNTVIIGKIVKPHGIKGELRLLPFYDDLNSIIEHTPQIYLIKASNFVKTEQPTSIRQNKKFLLIKFPDYNSINEVQELINCKVAVDKEFFLKNKEEGVLIEDMIGSKILDRDNSLVGELAEIFATPGNDVYRIITREGKELLVPGTREYILDINIEKKQIIIKVPEYI